MGVRVERGLKRVGCVQQGYREVVSGQAREGLNGWFDEQKDSVQSWPVGVRVEIRLWKKVLYIT